MKTEVLSLNEVDQKVWNDLAERCNVVCQTFEWAKGQHRGPCHAFFVHIWKNKELVAGWLFFEIQTPYFPSISIPSEPLIADTIPRAEAIELLWQELEKRKPVFIDWFTITNSRWGDKAFLLAKKFNSVHEYGSYILDLTKTNEVLWSEMDGKHRNMVRRAENEQISVTEHTSIDEYFELSEATYKRSQGSGPSRDELESIYSNLVPKGKATVYSAWQGDCIVSSAFITQCGTTALYWHGATCDNPPPGASNLLHWEIIQKLKLAGYEKYDFGGASLNVEASSKAAGINSFKKRFGGTLEVFYGGEKIYQPFRYKLFINLLRARQFSKRS